MRRNRKAKRLELEENPADHELIGRVFRAMHNIKGSGAMLGFENVSEFTNEIETVDDHVRGGDIAIDKNLVDLTLSGCDIIKKWSMQTLLMMLQKTQSYTICEKSFQVLPDLKRLAWKNPHSRHRCPVKPRIRAPRIPWLHRAPHYLPYSFQTL